MALPIQFPGMDALLLSANTISRSKTANIDYAIFQETIETSDFTRNHTITTGIEHGDMVPIVEKTKQWGFLKKSDPTVGCNYNASTLSDKISEKKWAPAKYDTQIKVCLTDPNFTRDFRAFWNINCAKYDNDLDNTLIAYIVSRSKESQNHSLWRQAYMDFKTNPNSDFAGIDGFFIQWFALSPVTNINQRVVITENAGATFADQMNLLADTGRNTIKALYDKMLKFAPHMIAKPSLAIEVTRDLALNYLHWLQNNKEVNCCFNTNHDGTTSSGYGLANLNYMGIPVITRHEWTELIAFDTLATAVKFDKPHRAVLTYGGNKSVGTCDENKLKEFKIVFDEVNETILIRLKSTLDVQIPLSKDFIIAY